MTMHPLIDQKRIEIAHICQRLGIEKLEVFGSAARGADFDPVRSDADFLVEFAPAAKRGPGRLLYAESRAGGTAWSQC